MLLVLHHEIGPPATAAALLHTLGGAVLVDLAHQGRVTTDGATVVAVGAGPPADALLRSAHAAVAGRPGPARSLVPELGAELWRPVIDRLVGRGRIRRERRRPMGLHPVVTRPPADPHHEAVLRARLRAVLESGERPDARTAAVLALLSPSGALPSLRRAGTGVGSGIGGSGIDGADADGVIAAAVRAMGTAAVPARAS